MTRAFPALACAMLAAALAGTAAAQSTNPVEPVVVRSVAHFDSGVAAIRSEDRPALLAEVAKMKNVTWQTITATGHADSRGTVALNERLSKRRAAAVKSYLVRNGIDAGMVRTVGKAAEEPVATNDTVDGRAANRRTEIRFEGIRTAMTN